jgi:hypothetical protein
MAIQLDKARKLISELEKKLNSTGEQAAEIRRNLDKWLHNGEIDLRKKGASALKNVRKHADSFAKSLGKLEKNLSGSLEKMALSLEKQAPVKEPKAEKASAETKKTTPSKKAGVKRKVASRKKAPARKAVATEKATASGSRKSAAKKKGASGAAGAPV